MWSSLESSPMISFFMVNFTMKFQIEHPKRGATWELDGENLQFSTKKLQCIRNYKTLVTLTDQQEVPYALSIGTKIIELGWPWMVDTHLIAEKMHLLEPNTNFNEDRPILSAVRWATNRSETAKIAECSVISQIFWILMTQRQVTLKDICGYLMLENFIGHVTWDAHHMLCFLSWWTLGLSVI